MNLLHPLIGLLVVAAVSASASSPAPTPSALTLVSATEPGTRLVISGQLTDASGRPVASARLHVYQTDAEGRYTREKPMDEPHARLAGWLQTDPLGHFQLSTIRPGGYPKALRLGDRDRKIPAHIHIDVSAGAVVRKVQVVFADDPLLSDPFWQDWIKRLHQPVLAVSRGNSGQTAVLALSLTHGEAG